MSTIHLVYAHENRDLAEKLTQDLGRVGLPFQHHTDRPEQPLGQLAAQVEATEGPVVFLITDNFFKSRHCMAGALPMFQTLVRQNRVLSIVADGKQSLDGGNTFEAVPTEFDRVVHAIQYMNYWQAAYLNRNASLPEVPAAEKEVYERELEFVRNIANEIGELFSALKEAKYYSWEALQKDDYALFFQKCNLQEWHEQYKTLSNLERQAPPTTTPLSTAPAATIAEIPAVPGPLVPAPTRETEPDLVNREEVPENTAFQEMDTLLEDLSAEAPSAQVPQPEPPSDDASSAAALEQIIRQATQDAWFWIEKGHLDRGLELFRAALEQYPNHEALEAEYQRALAYQEKLQNGQEQPPVVETENPPAPPTPEKESAPTAPPPDKNQEAASYLQMGENARAKGDYLLAKYCWDRVTDLQPDLPGIYRKLALLTSEHLTDYKETAAHYLEQALVTEPENADLHYRLALLLRDHLDQSGKALQHFRDAVVSQPDHGPSWLALAQYTLDAGDKHQAASLYQHALEVAPDLQTPEYDALFITAPEAPEEAPAAPVVAPTPEEEPPATVEPLRPADSPQPKALPTPEPLTVLITGASSGIGRATAELFARHGHRLILTGRREERLQEIKQAFTDAYQNEVLILPFDVRDPNAVKQSLQNLPETWQNIDLLVNNAGLAKGLSPIHEGELDHWETMIDTNLKGLLYVTRMVAPGMVKRQKGHIINIGSGAGKEVYPNGNVYCATKFAVDGLTRAMRLDLFSHNIRVSQVSPAHVEETEFALTRFDGDKEKAQIYKDFQPLKATDVAEVVYFIATRPAHVNIQDIWVLGTQQASSTLINRSGRPD